MLDAELIHHPGIQHNLILCDRQPAFYKVNETMPGGGFVSLVNLYPGVFEHLIP
ncbi:hypothetical protein D3C73_796430 [compost metagenome]